MKVKAFWKSINPFIPDINQLGYSKTIEVADDIDLKVVEQLAIEDSRSGYKFDRLEIVSENAKTSPKID